MLVAALPLVALACGAGGSGAPDPYQVTVQTIGAFPAGVHGMAADSDGTLWLSDSFASIFPLEKVYTLAPPYDGTPEATALMGRTISGLLWREDTLYACVTGEDAVRRYDRDLELLQEWSVPAPWNLSVLGAALVAVTYHGEVRRLEPDGSSSVLFGGLEFPFDLVAADALTLWVSEQVEADVHGRVRRFDLQGHELQRVARDLDNPEGLALDDRGALYIADTNAGELVRRLPDGTTEVLAAGLTAPIGFAALPGGDLLLNTSAANPQLIRIVLE